MERHDEAAMLHMTPPSDHRGLARMTFPAHGRPGNTEVAETSGAAP